MKAEADRDDQVGAVNTGGNSVGAVACAEADMATRLRTKAEVATTSLMETVVERGNLKLAYQRVIENKGAAGVDQLTVSELKDHPARIVVGARGSSIFCRMVAGRRPTIARPRSFRAESA